jgi:NADPH2:quinone reductase
LTVQIGTVDDLAGALREASGGGGFDLIVDPLWGEPAMAASKAAAPFARLVALGQSAGLEATFTSPDVRNNALHIVGHTNYKVPEHDRRAAYERMCAHADAGELTADYERVALEDVAAAWERLRGGPGAKLVVVP